MRVIGHLQSESAARTFSDFLYAQGIENQIESEKSHGWVVWIHEEGQLDRAGELLKNFHADPADPKFKTAARAAAERREQEQKAQAAYEKRIKRQRHLFQPLTGYGLGPLTIVFIAISVVVFIISRFGAEPQRVIVLFMTMPDILQGEVWRLFTPIFVHFGFLHIFFNMIWLHDLGSMIEGRQSTWMLAALALGIAAVSNIAQYVVSGPLFGGMSGVVYGLLGYIWIRGKFDPGSGLFLYPWTVVMMVIWFFICLTGLMGGVANAAHGAGLVSGMAWGYLSSLRHR